VLYGSLFHAKQAPAFIHAQHMPAAYRDFMHTAYDFPAPEAIEELREMGLRYLLLERSRYNGWRVDFWEDIEPVITQSPAVRVVTEVGDFVVLEFTEPEANTLPGATMRAGWCPVLAPRSALAND
jgi:F420-dependent methylenetetrahydromethanopterin dehydrogenase